MFLFFSFFLTVFLKKTGFAKHSWSFQISLPARRAGGKNYRMPYLQCSISFPYPLVSLPGGASVDSKCFISNFLYLLSFFVFFMLAGWTKRGVIARQWHPVGFEGSCCVLSLYLSLILFELFQFSLSFSDF